MSDIAEAEEESPDRWMTIQRDVPDLDTALVFVVRETSLNNFSVIPAITLQPTLGYDVMTGTMNVHYKCTITGRVDGKPLNLPQK